MEGFRKMDAIPISANSYNIIYQKTNLAVYRNILDELMLIPISGELAKQGCIYRLNELSSNIWELIDGKNTIYQISNEIASGYIDFNGEMIIHDVNEFLIELNNIGFISIVSDNDGL